jgi:hypothetical protein
LQARVERKGGADLHLLGFELVRGKADFGENDSISSGRNIDEDIAANVIGCFGLRSVGRGIG